MRVDPSKGSIRRIGPGEYQVCGQSRKFMADTDMGYSGVQSAQRFDRVRRSMANSDSAWCGISRIDGRREILPCRAVSWKRSGIRAGDLSGMM
jgi:hypothetical protein